MTSTDTPFIILHEFSTYHQELTTSYSPRRIFKQRRTHFPRLVTGDGKRRTTYLRCGNSTDKSVLIIRDVYFTDYLHESFVTVWLQCKNPYDCSYVGEKRMLGRIPTLQTSCRSTVHLQRGLIEGQGALKVIFKISTPMTVTLRWSNVDKPCQILQKYKYTLPGIVSHSAQQVTPSD